MKSYLYLHGVRLFNKPSDKPRNLTLVRASSVLETTRFSCIGLILASLENTLSGRVCELKTKGSMAKLKLLFVTLLIIKCCMMQPIGGRSPEFGVNHVYGVLYCGSIVFLLYAVHFRLMIGLLMFSLLIASYTLQ